MKQGNKGSITSDRLCQSEMYCFANASLSPCRECQNFPVTPSCQPTQVKVFLNSFSRRSAKQRFFSTKKRKKNHLVERGRPVAHHCFLSAVPCAHRHIWKVSLERFTLQNPNEIKNMPSNFLQIIKKCSLENCNIQPICKDRI